MSSDEEEEDADIITQLNEKSDGGKLNQSEAILKNCKLSELFF
jgi:hypothetical protein